MAARGSGGFLDVGYSMSPDEVAYWQDQAALLDPDAYVLFHGNTESETVPAGERWYLVNGWNLKATGQGTTWYHRPADVNRALMLPEGTTIETSEPGGGSIAFMYICQPSLVAGSDARYTTDPRALYFDRLIKMGELAQHRLGSTATGSGQVGDAFPGDFTDGLIVHVSVHDVAWMILLNTGGDGASNLHNEISDSSRIRWAEPLVMPFKRTTFPETLIQGVSQGEGRATLSYLKLDGSGW